MTGGGFFSRPSGAGWRLLNYAVDPKLLAPRVPAGTELDQFEGKTFVSLVGFRFLSTKVFGVPIPFHRNFDEVNLRFYVRRREAGMVKRGVVFIQELVPQARDCGRGPSGLSRKLPPFTDDAPD